MEPPAKRGSQEWLTVTTESPSTDTGSAGAGPTAGGPTSGTSPREPSASPASRAGGTPFPSKQELALANAAARAKKKRYARLRGPKKPWNAPKGPETVAHIAALKAEGIAQTRIAYALGVHPDFVKQVLAQPETQEAVKQRRELIKAATLQILSNTMLPAWGLMNKAIENGDAKEFDAATRGLHALEKISASVSGENRQAPAAQVAVVISPQQHLDEIKALILEENNPSRNPGA